MQRTSKIGHLPRAIRQTLNQRLDQGEPSVKTQTWTGLNAEVMNRQHRKLLLQASREAGLDLDQSRQDLENDPESSPVAPNQGESWQK